MPETSAILTSRASSKLNFLLTSLGYGLDSISRVNSLALKTCLSKRDASNLLSGLVKWTLDDIALLCESFGKPASYFLDSGPDQKIPADVTIVTSVDGGESTVWRAPSGFLEEERAFPNAPLRYLSTSTNGYFGENQVRVMLVFEDWSSIDARAPVTVNGGYIVADEKGCLKAMRCMDMNKTVAVFSDLQKSNADRLIVPLRMKSNVQKKGAHLVGKTIGCISGV